MKTDPNVPAAPCQTYQYSGHPLIGDELVFTPGLSKREYFAALAMQGILAKPNAISTNEKLALASVSMADALIEALNKPEVVKK